MFTHKHRAGFTDSDSQCIRSLRNRGFAVVVFNPLDVGGPLNRRVVEEEMLKAGKKACKLVEVRSK